MVRRTSYWAKCQHAQHCHWTSAGKAALSWNVKGTDPTAPEDIWCCCWNLIFLVPGFSESSGHWLSSWILDFLINPVSAILPLPSVLLKVFKISHSLSLQLSNIRGLRKGYVCVSKLDCEWNLMKEGTERLKPAHYSSLCSSIGELSFLVEVLHSQIPGLP